MRKTLLALFLGILLLLPTAPDAFGKRVHFGISAGSFPFTYLNTYCIKGELGFQFSERVGILAEVGYGYMTSEYESRSTSNSYSSSSKSENTYTISPMSLSLLYTAPLGKDLSAYIGAGVGYYKIKIKDTYTSTWSGTETDEDEGDGIIPHISIGLDFSVADHISLFGELKQGVGKITFEKTESEYYDEYHRKETYPVGGTEVRVGLRFSF